MKLVNFSVTNYRSITNAHKINLQNFTILVGKNNEGKSNLLNALSVAMKVLMHYGRTVDPLFFGYKFWRKIYDWNRDFPIQYQGRKHGLESIFKLEFCLDEEELAEFHKETKTTGNANIAVVIKINKDNEIRVEVPKRGTSTYNKKSQQIAKFISQRVSFNYIEAIRTQNMAIDVLKDVIVDRLQTLSKNEEYINCVDKINSLQQEILDNISEPLLEPLKLFLPQINNVRITVEKNDFLKKYIKNDIDIIIDDGTPTSINYKGDGVKSLATLAILKDRTPVLGAVSVIAIEEPESHLHPGAIHRLVEVIQNLSKNNQVIITTHNPLFVQQNNIKANVIVDNSTAHPAKNIAEVRDILGVLPSDNLKSASHILLVEGEDDKISLTKILSAMSDKISNALLTNRLIIKPMGGASNLSHDVADLKHCMCNFFVLLDYDNEANLALDKAINNNLITEANYKQTICNGCPEAEFEDCLKKSVYEEILLSEFQTDLNVSQFRGNKKWSDRIKDCRVSQGGRWSTEIEAKLKLRVAESIPENIKNIEDIVIPQKMGFLTGLVQSLERFIETPEIQI